MSKTYKNPWSWVPSLYFAEGLPNVVATSIATVMYTRMGIPAGKMALYTSLLYLPWVIKPLWSPFIDLYRTKRFWIVSMQLLIGLALAGIAAFLSADNFFPVTLAFMWFITFSSSTHDIAADGFYMIGLPKHDQALFVGIRSTFYRLAGVAGTGPLVILAGMLEKSSGSNSYAWSTAFAILAGLFVIFFLYHSFILPRPSEDISIAKKNNDSISFQEFFKSFISFFQKEKMTVILCFIILYRLGEAQLSKIAIPFLIAPVSKGGIGLDTEQVGYIYGTIGVIALTAGGIIGGIAAAKNGLKYWLWPMIIALNVPDLVYVYLAFTQDTNLITVSTMVILEQFGYGFGFTAFVLYLIYISDGEYKTSHYAIATGFMALGLLIPGAISGILQEWLGYKLFFIWVCIATIPGFILAKMLPLDPEFGKKSNI
jgi:PAT family beta-lactamase induction signal transducer AmpG